MLKQALLITGCALLLAACGKNEEKAPEAPVASAASAPAPAPAPAAAPAAASASAPAAQASAADTSNAAGEKTFKAVCSMCHQSGAAGAPIVGHKDDWAPRIAQGKDTLYKHAIEGFSGQKGAMPAKGGSATLSDADVKAAVDFMVAKAG